MGSHEEPWGSMGNHGEPWGAMGNLKTDVCICQQVNAISRYNCVCVVLHYKIQASAGLFAHADFVAKLGICTSSHLSCCLRLQVLPPDGPSPPVVTPVSASPAQGTETQQAASETVTKDHVGFSCQETAEFGESDTPSRMIA